MAIDERQDRPHDALPPESGEETSPYDPMLDDEEWLPSPSADPYDPEFEQLPTQINWTRPMVMLGVIGFAIYLGVQFMPQLKYALGDAEPQDLGDITEFPERARENPDDPPVVPHNRFVRVSGIPSRASISCNPPVRYYKLVGAHVYIEQRIEEGKLTELECKAGQSGRNPRDGDDLNYFEGTGRAVSFDRIGKNYNNLKGFYERSYGELFCSSMTEAKREARVKMLRQMLRETHKLEHGQYPDDETLEKLLADETICHDAYLIQADVSPSAYWHYLAIYVVLGLIILWSLGTITRWVRRHLV